MLGPCAWTDDSAHVALFLTANLLKTTYDDCAPISVPEFYPQTQKQQETTSNWGHWMASSKYKTVYLTLPCFYSSPSVGPEA